MPAKGQIYATVDVDMARWCGEYMEKYNLSQSDMARRLQINRGRVHLMLEGECNTNYYAEKAVTLCEGGNWMALSKYATSTEGSDWIEWKDARKGLTQEDRVALDRELNRYLKSGRVREVINLLKSNGKEK